jgi:hypothetical protein
MRESALGQRVEERCYCCSSWSASVSQLAAASSPATISKSLSSACSSCSHSAAAATPRFVNAKSTQHMPGQEAKTKARKEMGKMEKEGEGAPLWGPIHTSKGTRSEKDNVVWYKYCLPTPGRKEQRNILRERCTCYKFVLFWAGGWRGVGCSERVRRPFSSLSCT